MKVINFPQKYKFKSPTIILGGFEILHIGHQKLIKKAKENHDSDILMMIVDDVSLLPKNKGSKITSLNVRLQQMANIGINGAILLDVKKSKFLEMSGKKFIDLLVKNYGIKNIVCGKDFRYGNLAKSNSEDLKKYFKNTAVVDLTKHNNIKISSSIIKELVYYGNIEAANELLINDWTTQGIIDHGWIYVFPDKTLRPQPGIYFVEVEYQNILFPALMHMNLNKIAKIYLTNKNDNLLGRRVFVHWHKKIRPIIKNSNDGVDVKDSDQLKKIYKSK